MKVYHGSILTVNENNDVFEYLIENKGRIVFVGNELPGKYARAEKIELGKKALIPPFADTHQHLTSFSAFHAGLNVMEASSNEEILEMVREFADQAEGKTLIAFGASPYSVREGRLVSRDEKNRGSLETGKIADMVILSENPYTMPKDRINELRVEKLILKGKEYRPQAQSVAAVAIKGVLRHNRSIA